MTKEYNSTDNNTNEKYISLYVKDKVIKEIKNVYFSNLLDFLLQVKLYSCPELEINIVYYTDVVSFVFHFEKYIKGYDKPLVAYFEKSKAAQQELDTFYKLFKEYSSKVYTSPDNKMTIQNAIDILESPDCIDEKRENKGYDLTDDGTGKKYDSGKSMVGTLCRVFPRALLGVGKCIEFGTHKYPKPDNWKLVENAFVRYQDSLMRHYLKFLSGEIRDKETNILHLCHMAWNTLAILELYLMEHKEEFDKELFL